MHEYDWRKAEAAINAYDNYLVDVAGVPLIPWEIPDLWTQDLRRTFRSRR
ncbi:hypothetical protein AB0L63_31190 [Nocardia sp. NPDC051990]